MQTTSFTQQYALDHAARLRAAAARRRTLRTLARRRRRGDPVVTD